MTDERPDDCRGGVADRRRLLVAGVSDDQGVAVMPTPSEIEAAERVREREYRKELKKVAQDVLESGRQSDTDQGG